MATLIRDPASGIYRIAFRHQGKQFTRSLQTRDERMAEAMRGRVEETLALIATGRILVPQDAEPGTFILSDGKLTAKPRAKPKGVQDGHDDRATIGALIEVYRAELPAGAKEPNSLRTELGHLRNVERILGADLSLGSFDLAAAQDYAKRRGKERHGKRVKRPILPYTVRKELKSFRHVWSWCHARSLVPIGPDWELAHVTFPREQEPERFRTMAEIRAIVDRGGLPARQEKALWDALYLTGPETRRLLEHVRGLRLEPFVYPMFCIAAFTGARRSEILRSEVQDFDFRAGQVMIREKKRVKKMASSRWVDLHPELVAVMTDWFASHPGGKYTLARDDGSPLNVDVMDVRFDMATRGTEWSVMRGWHVLRHSFASALASAGVDQRIINAFMGHQSESMASRYRHLFPATRRSAILSLNM